MDITIGLRGVEEDLFHFESIEVHDYFVDRKGYEKNTKYILAKSATELCKELIELRNSLDEMRYEYHQEEKLFYRYDLLIEIIQRELDQYTLNEEGKFKDGEYIYYCWV